MASFLEQEMRRRGVQGIRPGLSRMAAVLPRLGSPEQDLGHVALIAGTNGKGSAAAMLEAILRAEGRSTCLYTSPHLVHFNERLCAGGMPVPDETLDAAARQAIAAEQAAGVQLTGFELVTAACFLVMQQQHPDAAVVEVGMGGRLDATNVVNPAVTVITPVGMDHMEYLGRDLAAIAGEKLGIVRPGVPCVCAMQSPDVLPLVERRCAAVGARLLLEGRDFRGLGSPDDWGFAGVPPALSHVRLSLAAQYQVSNAAVAVAAWTQMPGAAQGSAAARQGLEHACWPGRFDLRVVGGRQVVLDGGHNPHGMAALVEAFRARYAHRPAVLFAAKHDKACREMLRLLAPLASRFLLTRLPEVPGIEPAEMLRQVPEGVAACVVESQTVAWERLLAEDTGGPNLCCGSLYLVGYCLRFLEGEPK